MFCFSLSLKVRPGPVPNTNTVAALVVQVATLVEDQVALVGPACHPLDVACLHQGWTTDRPARPVVPMVLMGAIMEAHMAALMVAPTVVLMVDHMARTVPLAHMVLQVVHMVIIVDHMVDLQALMVLLVLVPTMAPTKGPPEDHLPTTCKVSLELCFEGWRHCKCVITVSSLHTAKDADLPNLSISEFSVHTQHDQALFKCVLASWHSGV